MTFEKRELAFRTFAKDDARSYGLTEAVILEELRFQFSIADKNNLVIHQGRYFITISLKELHALMKFMGSTLMRRALTNLKKKKKVLAVQLDYESEAYSYSLNEEDWEVTSYHPPKLSYDLLTASNV